MRSPSLLLALGALAATPVGCVPPVRYVTNTYAPTPPNPTFLAPTEPPNPHTKGHPAGDLASCC